MRKKKWFYRIILLSILSIILTGCSADQTFNEVKQVKNFPRYISVDLKPEDYAPVIDSIIETIDTHYAHKDRKSIEMDSLRLKYLKAVKTADNFADFNLLLLRLFAELKNSHSDIYTGISEFGAAVLCKFVEDRVVISYLRDRRLIDKNVSRGWIVKEINGQTAREWLEERFNIISASTPQALREQSLFWVFRRYRFEPSIREYLLAGPGGETLNIKLPLIVPADRLHLYDYPPIETKDFGGYGYIAINTMTDGIVELFDKALTEMKDKQGIIIDLRKNGGGNSVNGEKIMQRLIQQETPIWQNRSLKSSRIVNYSGRLVVLTGVHTFSAAESFAFNLHDSGRVTTMGGITRGDSGGGPVLFKTAGGLYFRIPTRGVDYSASGEPMEGKGLIPQITVTQSYEDFIEGRDTVLEVALKKIKE